MRGVIQDYETVYFNSRLKQKIQASAWTIEACRGIMQLRKVSAAHKINYNIILVKEYDLKNRAITFNKETGDKTAFFEMYEKPQWFLKKPYFAD